jgi:pyruvyltransferase
MKILILYNIDNKSIKYKYWHDGFTKALNILKIKYGFNVSMNNFFDNKNINLNNYDIVLLKTQFKSTLQKYTENYLKFNGKKTKVAICISSSNIIPDSDDLKLYDLMFYETEWYRKYSNLDRHPNIFHAFGVDRGIMKENKSPKIYDYIFVGNITSYKRPLKLLNKSGKNIAIGFLTDKKICDTLKKGNVSLIEFVNYLELSKYYNKSKKCYIPCETHGGGERAVLEARSCGIHVEIESDNLKLKELLTSDIYDSYYYSSQLKNGFLSVFTEKIPDIPLYYWKYSENQDNVGDKLSHIIINYVSKKRIDSVYENNNYKNKILSIGSILHLAKDNDIIWGSGIRTYEHKYNFKNLYVYLVRGPLTKKFLESKNIKCPNNFGDPGLLCSKYISRNKIITDKIGIVPHFTQLDKYRNLDNRFKIISPLLPYDIFINELTSCKTIISSSLHGIIIADSYKIPNYWLYKNKLNEGTLKFKDYFLSQKRTFKNYSSINECLKDSPTYGNHINIDKIIESFPYKLLNY